MNKTAIKNFATWARRKLISEITYKAGLIGISEKGISQPLSISTDNINFFDIGTGKPTEISDHEIKQRDALVSKIREKESTSDYKTAFQFVIEEVAYTWFNRLIAIRFMEVNDYLPSRIRVISSTTQGKTEPDMVTTPFDTDMVYSAYEKDRIIQLKHENELDELFRMLFIKQCNKLNEVLPELFERTEDYTEMLLTLSFTDSDGIVYHLVNDIDADDFIEAVEIIGWMYQYYNNEPKDDVFALLKKNVKINKDRIPAATQLFTPDWIVRYMVENSLGRLWVEGHPNDSLKSEWKYYLEEAVQEESVESELEKIRLEYRNVDLENIKVLDPCMGSGHILVYAFDVLMQIYESQGYTQRDAAVAIIKNNLYGLDIDDRAYQLAYFSVMMKARKYDRRFLNREISPKVYSIKESNAINKAHLHYFGSSLSELERNIANQQMEYLLDSMKDAKEFGSLINVNSCDWELLYKFADDFKLEGQMTFDSIGSVNSQVSLRRIISVCEILANKYDVVSTNPPYIGRRNMNDRLKEYLDLNYQRSKNDLFGAVIDRCLGFTLENRFTSLITMHSWMFLLYFEKIRKHIVDNFRITNMIHLGARAFEEISGEVVQTSAFVITKHQSELYKGVYSDLRIYDNPELKKKNITNKSNIYLSSNKRVKRLPSYPISYWMSDRMVNLFGEELVENYIQTVGQNLTGNNEKYLRFVWEVSMNEIGINRKWLSYAKGGGFRRWYGNNEYVVNWLPETISHYKKDKICRLIPEEFWYKKGISMNLMATNEPCFRLLREDTTHDIAASSFYVDEEYYYVILGLLNSVISKAFMNIFNPTMSYQLGDVSKIPFVDFKTAYSNITVLVQENISISKTDWDSFETSLEFIRHPLIKDMDTISDSFYQWDNFVKSQFDRLRSNEENLNQLFIDIYELHNELESSVEEKSVTIRKANLERDIRSFISYAVGCMLGRYSLDVDGLAYAGGEFDVKKYKTFIPDKDNCIPITDEEYFEDDIVSRFIEFVKSVYGAENFEENLDFIAKVIDNKGDTSRAIIRNYFVKDFYKDHVKTYQKRPIYWLFDSGKQDGFKALVYMHRYTADTTGIVRVDYLHKMQKIYMSEIDRMKDMAENSNNAREVAQAEKRKEKLIKQLKETKDYDEKIAHLALSRIVIDLDDGVKVNYEKVQTGQDGKKLDILGKI